MGDSVQQLTVTWDDLCAAGSTSGDRSGQFKVTAGAGHKVTRRVPLAAASRQVHAGRARQPGQRWPPSRVPERQALAFFDCEIHEFLGRVIYHQVAPELPAIRTVAGARSRAAWSAAPRDVCVRLLARQ